VKDEWKPLLAACLIILCVCLGFGLIISPTSPWLPYVAALNNEGAINHSSREDRQEESKSSHPVATPPKFFGTLHEDPNHCYQDEQQGECAARIVQNWIAGFYPLIGVATLLQAFAASGTFWLIIRQLNVTKQQLRAYVFVAGAQITNIFEGSELPRAVVLIRNSGQTPAHDVVNVSSVLSTRYPHSSTMNPTITEAIFATAGRTRQTLGPGDTSISVTVAPGIPSEEQRLAITNGARVVYVYGEIRYRDVFKKRQRTRYRYMIGGPAGIQMMDSVGGTREGRLVGCEEGNEAT
jgi:hypothetical protein